MKKFYLTLSIILVLQNLSSAQNYTRFWASLYTDTTAYLMHINYLAVDSTGNSYVAGYKIYNGGNYYDTHMFLLKVNTGGTQEWIRYFDNGTDSIDAPYGLTLDASGNVYLTGARIDTFCNICTYSSKISDIITTKYDPAGNMLWLNRYHDSIYILAQPSGIALSEDGAEIVTGSDGSQTIIEKINKNGKTVWIKKWSDVVFNTACFDTQGNIIIGGASDPDHVYQTEKPMVMKLTANGNLLWSNTYDEYRKNGRIYFVQCDSANNIYANGQTDTIAFYNNPKIITIKYNTSGQQQWFRKEEDHSITLPPYEGDFTIDAAGNAYVTGYVDVSGSNDNWVTTKYNNAGTRQWIAHFDDSIHASDRTVGLAVGKTGTTYVTGYSGTQSGFDIRTTAYNNSGKVIASDTYKPAKRSNGLAAGIGLDKNGNVYVSGEVGYNKNPYPYLTVIKYGKSLPVSGIQPRKTIYDLEIFPNPVINTLNIAFKTSARLKNYYCTIKHINGVEALHTELYETGNIVHSNFDVRLLQPGMYTVSISNGIDIVTKTFIKQ